MLPTKHVLTSADSLRMAQLVESLRVSSGIVGRRLRQLRIAGVSRVVELRRQPT